ncbi:MFS-type transporter SLC18B1-like [Diaphorina citri]|uniref:MFS-type transporter SLC18B1-like n=1 Tax=Diaphorina citri TaxID=121845 RepID=A0A3Q0JBV8_DIACI|nr:MFS-type transporter SLC18B1-like [Diaphorina citri]
MNFRRGEIPQEKYNASFAITLDRFVRSQSSLSDLERLCPIRFSLLPQIRSNSEFAIYCFLVRGMEALGASAFSTASFVYVIHLFPDNVGAVLGILETFVGLGMSIGPALGGILYSIGGFALPFYILGFLMILLVPVYLHVLPSVQVQLNLSSSEMGFVFLLFSALYGIFSPFWGYIADKIDNHWSMMVTGLLLTTVGLLLLGPSGFLPYNENVLWLNLVSLSIIGVSVSLTLMPTFKGLLQCAIDNGFKDSIATYSIVAGLWSCAYSLGDMLGPSIGGVLLEQFNFPVCATSMAIMSFITVTITLFIVCSRSGHNRRCGGGCIAG